MKRIKYLVATIALLLGLTMFTMPALAAGPVNVIDGNKDACTGNTNICGNDGKKLFAIVKNIINLMLYAAGVIAIIMIVIGGINYALSSGDNSKVQSAKNTVLYAVVGLVIASLAFAIVNFVVNRLF